MEGNLGRKLFTGTLWTVAARFGIRGLSVINTIILARLLTPADFGIVAMASIVTTLMAACTETGLNQVIIYYRNTDKSFYDTAWTIQMIRGFVLGIVLILFSRFIANFFDEPKLTHVLLFLSVVFILNGLISANIVTFQKEMRFDKEFYYRISTNGMNFVGTILLALWLRNYWAMVFGNIIFAISCVVFSFLYAPGFPKPTLHHWRKIFNFSQWIFLRETSIFIGQKLDQIIVGRWFGKALLGQYDMATQIATLPSTEMSMPLSRSLFPALAKMQDDHKQFCFTLSMSISVILLIVLPTCCGLIMIAHPTVMLLLPRNWDHVGALIQILSVYGLFRVIYTPCSSAMTAKGKVRVVFFINIFDITLKCICLYLGYIYGGIIGIAWATVISTCIVALLYLVCVRYNNYMDFTILLKQMWRPIIASIIMILSVHGIQHIVTVMTFGLLIEVVVMVTTGIFTYGLIIFGLWWITGKPNDSVEAKLFNISVSLFKKA